MLNSEYLESNGFTKVKFPDGFFYIRHYNAFYYLQVSEDFTDICAADESWVDELTAEGLIATIERHDKAINQYIVK